MSAQNRRRSERAAQTPAGARLHRTSEQVADGFGVPASATNPSAWAPVALPLKLKVGTGFFGKPENRPPEKISIAIRRFS